MNMTSNPYLVTARPTAPREVHGTSIYPSNKPAPVAPVQAKQNDTSESKDALELERYNLSCANWEIGRYKLVLKEEEDKNRKLEQDNKDINMWADDVQNRLVQLIKDYSRRDDELSEALNHIEELKRTCAYMENEMLTSETKVTSSEKELQRTMSELTGTKETLAGTKARLAETVAQLRALQKRIDDLNVPEYSEIGVAPPARRPLPGQLRM